MATGKTTGNSEFLEFLKGAPTLDEATSQDTAELTGIVSRTEDGKFAITTAEGQTYELEAAAVQRFRAIEAPGFHKIATIQILSEAMKAATLRPIKPLFKEMIKDPIKDVIGDGGKYPPFDKYPPADKFPPLDKRPPIDTLAAKDLRTDPAVDQKQMITDPAVDKRVFKDIHKDPILDPPKRFIDDGTGPADLQNPGDPIEQVVNPAAMAVGQGPMPFAMATPHHAPQHLLAMQMGIQPPGFGGAQGQKPLPWDKQPWNEKVQWSDTHKEMIWDNTRKEMIRDTIKEIIHDTAKEMIWDPQNTLVEGIPDPTQGAGPHPEPWAGGMPGFM